MISRWPSIMEVVLWLAGAVWIALGLSVLDSAKGALHEILACLAVSFGIVFWGFMGVIAQLRRIAAQGRRQGAAATEDTIEQAIQNVRTGPLKSRI